MRRREFITLVGGAAAWPVVARGQPATMPVIGLLGSTSPDLHIDQLRAFRQGLSNTGFVEGQNVAIEYRWVQGRNDRAPEMAADLVRRKVNVIFTTNNTPLALAAKAATTTIPVIFSIGTDPVDVGLVASINRPGGNVTGTTGLGSELGLKRLELLHELIPNATVVALLFNPTTPISAGLERDMQSAARSRGLQPHVLHASSERDLDAVFEKLIQLRAGALLIAIDPLFTSRSAQIAALALRHAVPASYVYRQFAVAGGLMSYGASIAEGASQAGIYTGRVLKGEKPADLPVLRATKVELFINLKTAKALGINVPLSLLGRADEVIE